jgi:hypothetical protein
MGCSVRAEDEFVGPFPSWRDLKRDFGAVGDGRADDTAALQRALDALTKHTNFCVLYVPAGTYRLAETVTTVRKAHTDCQGVAVIGEDPARTILRWEGPANGTMFHWDAWYSKISRLTLDGLGRARVALMYGPAFSTYNETSDLVFRDAAIGILFGDDQTNGQAENEVLRCQFVRCTEAGVMTRNWNSMDIWVWYSRFEDCGHGLYNMMGNFHAWQNLFLRSRIADIGSKNLMVFSFVNNTSIGSRRFLDFDTGHTWGSPTTVSGNRILDPTDDFALKLGNAGPYLIMDNAFKLPASSTNRAAKMTWADQTFVGNTYTKPKAVLENGRFRRIAEQIVARESVDSKPPSLPPTPPRRERKVFDVAPGADADAIQGAIDAAARLSGDRPVVHLPLGVYPIVRTLVVPHGCDVQLTGDGAGETATRLNWTGPEGGVLLRLEGPSRATLRDLYLHAPNARALVVEHADQPGGRIFADQLNVNGSGGKSEPGASAVRINGLGQTDVLLRCLQGSGNAGAWVEVSGGPQRAARAAINQVSIFNGATGSAVGQYHVHHGGQLVVRGVYHEKSADSLCGIHLNDSGTLAIDATRFSYKTSPTAPLVAVENFNGFFTLATAILMPVDSTNTCRFEVTGDGRAAGVLSLNNQFLIYEPGVSADKVWFNRANPRAAGGLIGCNLNVMDPQLKEAIPSGYALLDRGRDNGDPAKAAAGARALENRGEVDDAMLLRHLAPLREARVWLPSRAPADVTDLRFYRVMVSGGREAAVEFCRSATEAVKLASGPLSMRVDASGSIGHVQWHGKPLGPDGPVPVAEVQLGSQTLRCDQPFDVRLSGGEVHVGYRWSAPAALRLQVRLKLSHHGNRVVLTREVNLEGPVPLGADLTVRVPLGPFRLPPGTWLPLKNGLGGKLESARRAAYHLAGFADTNAVSLAIPLASFGRGDRPNRVTLMTDPYFSTLLAPERFEWTYPAAVGLQNGRETRQMVTVLHDGTPDEAIGAFYSEVLPEIEAGPQWLHDIALIDYDYLSDGGQGWFRDVDALCAVLARKDRRKVFLCLHGWYDYVGRYCFDAQAGKLDRSWTAFSNAPQVQGHRTMTNSEGAVLEVGFTNHHPVALTLEDVHRRIDYAGTRGFRVGLYFADGMNACDGLPEFDPSRVLYWGGWQGPDTRGKTYCQNPLAPTVKSFFLDYTDALLKEFGHSVDAFVWDETFHVSAGQQGSPAFPGYADRAMMRLVQAVTLKVQQYARQHHRSLALLTSDCIGPINSDRLAPYALMAHGTYQDSHCRPDYWSYGLFPNYRNVQWSCNWWPVTTWSYVAFGARRYQTPVVISNGWGDDQGFSELSPERRQAVLDLFRWRKHFATRLRWLEQLPAYSPVPTKQSQPKAAASVRCGYKKR